MTPETSILPPVQRGDIQILIEEIHPATIVIVDGTHLNYSQVSHIEIENALKQGWQVWGLGSIGAIRAAEMYEAGMRGYGAVYQRLMIDKEYPDNYLALVYGKENPWCPASEPLIHIEYLLQDALRQAVINQKIYDQMMYELRNMWFGFRTLKYLRERTSILLNGRNQRFCEILNNINSYRIKSHDVINFFERKVFLQDDNSRG